MSNSNDKRFEIIRLEKEFNKARESLHNKVNIYFRQAISNNYISEQDIMSDLFECSRIKTEHKDLLADLGIASYRQQVK